MKAFIMEQTARLHKGQIVTQIDLPCDSNKLNEVINKFNIFSIEKSNNKYYIDIIIDDIGYKIVNCEHLSEVNSVYFLMDIILKNNLCDDLKYLLKYDFRSKFDESMQLGIHPLYNFVDKLLEVIKHNCKEDLISLTNKKDITHIDPEYFLNVTSINDLEYGGDSFFSGTNSKYIFQRYNDICKFLENKTNRKWVYSDESIYSIGMNGDNSFDHYTPKMYTTINNASTNVSFNIKEIDNVFCVDASVSIPDKKIPYAKNTPIIDYISCGYPISGPSLIYFGCTAQSWDDIIEFINRVTTYCDIRTDEINNMIDDRKYWELKNKRIKDYNEKYSTAQDISDTELEEKLFENTL